MRLVVCDTHEVGDKAAGFVLEALHAARRRPVLGVATGSTPRSTYAALARARRVDPSAEAVLRGVSLVALDEYVGLPTSDARSYHATLIREVARPLGLDPSRLHVPLGSTNDLDGAAEAFERQVSHLGGVDVQILGIGTNGHVAFNEPGTEWDSRTRTTELTAETRRANARFFDSLDDVPHRALTQGIATILGARRLLLLATGTTKSAAVAAALEGAAGVHLPASALRDHHDLTVVLDHDAAAELCARSATR